MSENSSSMNVVPVHQASLVLMESIALVSYTFKVQNLSIFENKTMSVIDGL